MGYWCISPSQISKRRREMSRVYGSDRALYKVYALKNGNRVATMRTIAHTKLEAYYDCKPHFPEHDGFDYDHVRFAEDNEPVGVILSKNDKKRK